MDRGAFDREWALIVFRRTLGRSEAGYNERGKGAVLAAIKPFLPGDPDARELAQVSDRLGIPAGGLRDRIVRMRARYRACLEAEVADTLVGSAGIGGEIDRLAERVAGGSNRA